MAATRVRIRLLLPHADEAVALAVSTGAHLLLLAVLAGFGARSAALGTGRPVRPVMTVDLSAAASPPAPARPAASPPPARPEPEPEPRPVARAPTRRQVDAPPPETGPEPDTTASTRELPEPEPVPPSPGPSAPQTEASESPVDPGPAGTEVPALTVPGGGIAGAFTDDDSFSADWYVNLVHTRLADAWRERPVLPAGRETMRAVVSFRIMKSGAVRDVTLAIPSGFTPLDQSALRAVESLGRLPALPRGYEKESVPARFVFELVPGSP